VITNQHKKALNQLTKLLNQYHLANDDIHGARFQNVGPLSIEDRTVVNQRLCLNFVAETSRDGPNVSTGEVKEF